MRECVQRVCGGHGITGDVDHGVPVSCGGVVGFHALGAISFQPGCPLGRFRCRAAGKAADIMPGCHGLAGNFCGQEDGPPEDKNAHAATVRR
jgi:hypothetical protein